MKMWKRLTVLILLCSIIVTVPCSRAYALSDIDFTIQVDTDSQYASGMTIKSPILIKTQTENGYVEMHMLLKYNPDILNCTTVYQDQDGFSLTTTDEGLQIDYLAPNNSKSEIGTVELKVEFAVMSGIPSGKYNLELEVQKDNVYGIDQYGNKTPGILTISDAKVKELTFIETNDDSAATTANGATDPNFYFSTTTTPVQSTDGKGGCASPGAVIGFIIGALVMFAAGFVTGFIVCQKRLNEDSYTGYDNRGAQDQQYGYSRRDSLDSVDSDYDPVSDRGSGSIYDDIGAGGSESYSARSRKSSEVPSEDDGVDTDYFGRAAETRLGSGAPISGGASSYFDDDDDDDDGFPDQFRPTRYSGGNDDDDRASGFSSPAGRRRERSDDGYGSFDDEDRFSSRNKYR